MPSPTPEKRVLRARSRADGSRRLGASARLLLAQQGVEAAADLEAALGRVGLQQLLARGGGDGQVLAGQVDPGHRLLRPPLLVEERAQVGVGVEVAGEGLDRGAPVVARRRPRRSGSTSATSVSMPITASRRGRGCSAVELDAVAAVGKRRVLGEVGDGAHSCRSRGDGLALRVALGHGEDARARSAARSPARARAAGAVTTTRQRGLGEEAEVPQRQHGQEDVRARCARTGCRRVSCATVGAHRTTRCRAAAAATSAAGPGRGRRGPRPGSSST